MVIAVDFDGTICEDRFPKMGPPNIRLISSLIEAQKQGHRVILWTCRRGPALKEAVEYCEIWGLYLDGINDRPADDPDIYAVPSSNANYVKVFADIYIDDRALSPDQFCISLKEFSKRP